MDDTDYAFGRTHGEYERLIEQAELMRPLTERMLLAAGISRGMHVLDVGCGVGDVSFLVAGLVGPEGSVIGIDLDAGALKLAEHRRIAQGISNVEFGKSDARSVVPKRPFDAAVGRHVLQFSLSQLTMRLGEIVTIARIDPHGRRSHLDQRQPDFALIAAGGLQHHQRRSAPDQLLYQSGHCSRSSVFLEPAYGQCQRNCLTPGHFYPPTK